MLLKLLTLLSWVLAAAACSAEENDSARSFSAPPGVATPTAPTALSSPTALSELDPLLLDAPLERSTMQALREQADAALRQLSPVRDRITGETIAATEGAQEEVRKLFRWEYRVIDLDPGAAAEAHQEALGELGRERWECFHLQHLGDVLRAYCRRPPPTPLRILPFLPKPF